MNEKHLLVLFFNEDYSKNIPVLERIYASRFPDRLYIVPDHHSRFELGYRDVNVRYRTVNRADRMYCKARRAFGKRNRHELRDVTVTAPIVRVAGFKYFFQDYFWQARKALHEQNADWYWFVADDVFLNPKISADWMLDFFSVSAASTGSVLCEPYYRSDEWVEFFQTDYDKTIEDLVALDAYAVNRRNRVFADDPHKSGSNQRRVIAGCADFFGCHKSLLTQTLTAFHALAMRKVFVEIAVPNVLLSLDEGARMTSDYAWEFDTDRGNVERIEDYIESTPMNSVFYHPVKLGILTPEFIERVIVNGDWK